MNEVYSGAGRAPGGWSRGAVVVVAGAVAAVAALATAGLTAVLVNVAERRQGTRDPSSRAVDLTEDTVDAAIWGRKFPLQHDAYLRTVVRQRTRFGGSEALPAAPGEADPRLRTMWAGYPFSADLRTKRGHAYMLEARTYTRRVQEFRPCLHCHGSVYVAYRRAGGGDLIRGFEIVNQKPYEDARALVTHPLSCIDCHDPLSMQLRVTRPGFLEGIRALKASQGVADYDVNRMATRQEMRSYVCGQCHVEYYFRGDEMRLRYPWAKGLKVEEIYADYQAAGFKDWSHAETAAPVLKAQHPEFEMWSQGIHARSGVACADCHMPHTRAGALEISDHHVRSPLLNVARACQPCHRWSEQDLRDRAEAIQGRVAGLRNRALDALVALVADLRAAEQAGLGDELLAPAREAQRRGQFYVDFVESESSNGFHAPQEAVRILAEAIDLLRQGQLALRPRRAAAPAGAARKGD